MTRIIAGSAGGRRLAVPRGSATRPTSDRVRESLFSRLEAMGAVAGSRVLDLYAGSGALGLEALSRGAVSAVLVEADRRAAAVARDNARSLGFASVVVVADRVERYLAGRAPEDPPVDLVLCDPPYSVTDAALGGVLEALSAAVAPAAVVAVERSARTPEPSWPGRWTPLDGRRTGETTLWLARAAAPDRADEGDR